MFGIKAIMTKELKKNGIRTAEKDGAIVKIEHLKTYQLVSLYNKMKNKNV